MSRWTGGHDDSRQTTHLGRLERASGVEVVRVGGSELDLQPVKLLPGPRDRPDGLASHVWPHAEQREIAFHTIWTHLRVQRYEPVGVHSPVDVA